MKETVVTYEPDNSLKKGYFSIISEIFREFISNKWLLWQLLRRNFFSIYKQSFLGIFWAFLMPLFSVGTFILLNQSGIFNLGKINVPYPIYALLGVTFWQIFSTGVTTGATALLDASSMITRINFSKKCLVIAKIGKPILILSIQCVLLGSLFAFYRIVPDIKTLLLPIVLIPILFLVVSLGFILALFNAFIKDVGNGLAILINFLMFLTPVLYVKPKVGILAFVTKFNPMYYFISTARDLVLTGTISEPKGFAISTIASVILFGVCLILFHLTETRITERI